MIRMSGEKGGRDSSPYAEENWEYLDFVKRTLKGGKSLLERQNRHKL